MQPTIPQTQTTGTADMDLPAVQSMDWLFKKERIYLLAQFWQQRATLAEKEVNTLKEQLSGSTTTSPLSPTTPSTTNSLSTISPSTTTVTASAILAAVSPTQAVSATATVATVPNKITLNNNNNNNNNINSNNNNTNSKTTVNSFAITQQNGLPSPASSPPSSNCGSTTTTPPTTTPITNNCIGVGLNLLPNSVTIATNLLSSSTTTPPALNKLLHLNNNKMDDGNSMTSLTSMTADIKLEEQLHNNNNNSNSSNNNNNNNNSANSTSNLIRSSTPIENKSNTSADCPSNLSNVNSNSNSCNTSNNNSSSNNKSTSATTLVDELAAKDKEIKALIDEVTRLTALQESHIVQIQRLEERLEVKRQHIQRLESRLRSQSLNLVDDDVKKENSNIIPTLDITSPAVAAAAAAAAASAATDAKQFQELLLEQTKALAAAQNEALKSSSSSDGSATPLQTCKSQTSSLVEQSTTPLTTTAATTMNRSADVSSPINHNINNTTSPPTISNKLSSTTPPKTRTISRSATSTPFGGSTFPVAAPGVGHFANNSTTIGGGECSRDNQNSPHSSNGGGSGGGSSGSNFHNVEQFGSFLGEEIVSNWRRGFELPPLPLAPPSIAVTSAAAAAVAAAIATQATTPIPFQAMPPSTRPSTAPSTTTLLSQLVNSTFSNSLQTDTNSGVVAGNLNNCHQDNMDKASSHHDNSSTASTPNLQDSRSIDEHMNGSCGPGGLTPMSLQMMKNQAEDNNNTLGSLPHVPAGFLPGLPFQFQDRGHFRFAEDLQMPPGSMAGRLGESLIPKGDPMEAKLQEMLRYNMDKYANQNLDTLHISRRVRELLSVHNIGQRLFAKYILGLSQGTVSELLSKPKPWDKLTEKGRDSYRKMHAWGCDDNAVLLLKSLIPKKDSGMPQYGRSDDSMSDDRLAHILTEASNLMKTPQGHNPAHLHHHQQQQQHQQATQQFQQAAQQQQQQHQQHQQQLQQQQLQSLHQSSSGQEDSHSNEDSKSPLNDSPSPFYKDALQRRIKKYDNDDIPQDKVARIYQEELAKLMTRGPRDAFQSGGMPPAAAAAANQPMPDENIRMALEAYHRELAKLQQTGGAIPNFPNLPGLLALQQQALNGAQDLSCKKAEKVMKLNGQQQNSFSMDSCDQSTKDSTTTVEDALRHSSAFSLVRPKQEPGTPAPNNVNTNASSTAPSPLGNSILPPAMTPNDDFSSAASPLQRMASITNSLITQAPVQPHHSTPQRPMKAVLPPITQQQFDMFNNLNTEDIVRRVKEALSQYSISQRLFGESVLGLSQGSVSDLLARPKPWHMLTQKGREPFIRMKMFLEDDNAVHKLVASQYKIAPEKLMRTGNYSGSPQIPTGLSQKMVPMQKMMNEMKMQDAPQHLMQLQASVMAHIPSSQHQGMLLTPPGLPPHHAINLPTHNEKKPMMMPSVHSPQQNNAMRGMHQHMSPTVYEMAALTHDLDTQVITTKIKEALLANNIGQKIFGEAVLGLSQGSVSELLSKPKPWHMLSIKGREPFIRMQLWLSDANNVERLQAIKIERREASKRRRSTGPGTQDNSSDTSSNDTADFYTSSPGPGSVGSAGVPPNKKQRVLFSEEQKEALRLAFALDPYPNVATIEFLASELALATRTITNWFHNHRMRLKQQVPHGTPSEPVPSRENQSGTPFDPVQFRILLNQRLMELQKERMGLSGVPIPYPPYFTTNPNLAALIGRGLLPGNEPSLAALNNAFKEQMSGLDLTMNALKRERNDDFDDDGEEESHLSDTESMDGSDNKSELKETPTSSRLSGSTLGQSRTSRRKPAAPQWVNPDWQDGTTGHPPIGGPITEPEVIINGVCVMQNQAADYSRKAGSEETVRVEPTDVQDHHQFIDDDAEDELGSDQEDDDDRRSQLSNKQSECGENEGDDPDMPNDEKNDDCESVTEDRSSAIGGTDCGATEQKAGDEEDDEDEEEGESGWNY